MREILKRGLRKFSRKYKENLKKTEKNSKRNFERSEVIFDKIRRKLETNGIEIERNLER